MKRLSLAFLLYLFALNIPAEASLESSMNGVFQGIGVGGTVFNTWGFTYRQFFSSSWGLSLSLGPWFNNGFGRVGLALGPSYTIAHYKFPKSPLPTSSIRVYLASYASAVYNFQKEYREIRGMRLSDLQHSVEIGVGLGPAIEYSFTSNFALHAELPWMIMNNITPRDGMRFSTSYPHFGGGFTYYF